MDVVTTRLFDTYEHATAAVADLEASGVPHNAVSLVANNSDNRHGNGTAPIEETEPADAVADSAGTGASVGTVLGGGLMPLIAALLFAAGGDTPWLIAGYLSVLSVLSVAAALAAKSAQPSTSVPWNTSAASAADSSSDRIRRTVRAKQISRPRIT